MEEAYNFYTNCFEPESEFFEGIPITAFPNTTADEDIQSGHEDSLEANSEFYRWFHCQPMNTCNGSGNEGQPGNYENQQKNLEDFESALEFIARMDEKEKTPEKQKMERERVAVITQWLMNDTDLPAPNPSCPIRHSFSPFKINNQPFFGQEQICSPGPIDWMPSNSSTSIADNPMTSRKNFVPDDYGHTDQPNYEETSKMRDIPPPIRQSTDHKDRNCETVKAKKPRFDDSLARIHYSPKGGQADPKGRPHACIHSSPEQSQADPNTDTDFHAANQVIVGDTVEGVVHGPVDSPHETFDYFVNTSQSSFEPKSNQDLVVEDPQTDAQIAEKITAYRSLFLDRGQYSAASEEELFMAAQYLYENRERHDFVEVKDRANAYKGSDRPFKCNFCPFYSMTRTFNSKEEIIRHFRRHLKDFTFVCKYCQKGFPRSDKRKSMLRITTQIRLADVDDQFRLNRSLGKFNLLLRSKFILSVLKNIVLIPFKQNEAPLHQMQTNTNSTNAMHTRENQNHSGASSQNAAFAVQILPQLQNPCSNGSQNCYLSNVDSYTTSSVQPIASIAYNNVIQNTVSSNQMPINTNFPNTMHNIHNQSHYGARFQNPVPSSQLTPQSQNLQNNQNTVPSNQMPIISNSTNTMHTPNNQNIADAPFQNAAFAGHLTPQSQTAVSQNYYVSNVNLHNDSGNDWQVGNNETQQKNLEEFESALEFMDAMDEKNMTPEEQKMEKERVAKITQWLMNDTDSPGWMPSNSSTSIADNPMTSRKHFIPGDYGHTDQTNNEETPKISDINYVPVEAKRPRFDDSLTKTDRYEDTDYHASNEVIVGYYEEGDVHGPVGSPIETFSPIVQNQNTTSSNQMPINTNFTNKMHNIYNQNHTGARFQNHVPASQLTPQLQNPQNNQYGNLPFYNASQKSQASQIDFTTTSLGSLEDIFDQLNSPSSNTFEDQYCSNQQHYNFPKISDSHNSSNVTDTAPTSTNALPNYDAMGDTETDLVTEFDKMFPYNGSEQMNDENDLDYYHEQLISSNELGSFDKKPEFGPVYVEQTSSVTLHAQSFQQNIHDTGDYHAVNNNVSTGFEPKADAVMVQTQPTCKNSPSLRDMLGKKEILKTLSEEERSEIAQKLTKDRMQATTRRMNITVICAAFSRKKTLLVKYEPSTVWTKSSDIIVDT
ncbi:Oidioi.mRNA.OKI2018_I69.PAR.g13139.t1.cds [Oikopleura dioica]|uniref:Oidioi.mRNA.OKI2018_I69.PAR.g13139.t1.cds n=1 Tax=Oikopleura dioica TaxID=34765 RepID=A0ABN7SA44_OIKDI|nr:Oidioi.mRNA.OKI2018_I69.PAR.g13139.t1.cds [Oikopleura dioica]